MSWYSPLFSLVWLTGVWGNDGGGGTSHSLFVLELSTVLGRRGFIRRLYVLPMCTTACWRARRIWMLVLRRNLVKRKIFLKESGLDDWMCWFLHPPTSGHPPALMVVLSQSREYRWSITWCSERQSRERALNSADIYWVPPVPSAIGTQNPCFSSQGAEVCTHMTTNTKETGSSEEKDKGLGDPVGGKDYF